MHVARARLRNEELAAYYDVADAFVCASEHEGFCVPLMEAFHMGVPVIAYAATAVPATLDGGGVLVTDKDPLEVAALIDEVVTDGGLRIGSSASQDAALERLAAKDFGGTLLGYRRSALGAAPQATATGRPSTSGIRSRRRGARRAARLSARRRIRRCRKTGRIGAGLGARDSNAHGTEPIRAKPRTASR